MTHRSAFACFSSVASPALLARAAVLSLMMLSGSAFGQAAAPDAAQKEADANATHLIQDFAHYVKIASFDAAAGTGTQFLDLKLAPTKLVDIIEKSGDQQKINDALQIAARRPELADIAGKIMKAFEDGKLQRARDPKEIAKAIEDLTGTVRGRLLARERLLFAGEYALPQLLENLLKNDNAARSAEVQRVLIDLGRQSEIPLSVAMMKMPAAQQERVANVLGLIPWKTSLPFLKDLSETTQNDNVKQACQRAINALGGASQSTQELYQALAEDYYAEKAESLSFPGEEFQLLWSYDPGTGLNEIAIRTEVYNEAMAMRLDERAMEIEQGNGGVSPQALALWIAANFSREIDTPKGYINPVYPLPGLAANGAKPRRTADYFAAAAGGGVAQLVLARALDARDTPLARKALHIVEETAGGRAIQPDGERTPLVDALTYPDRRVQTEAALAIGISQPQETFSGAERVVPTLASGLKGSTAQYAVVIGGNTENYQVARRSLEKLGYSVLPHGDHLADIATLVAEAPSIDFVMVLGQNSEKLPPVVDEIRGTIKTAASPVLAMTGPESYSELRHRYDGTQGVGVRQVGISEDQTEKAITDLAIATTGGPISAGEAADYAKRCLAALRDLAVSGNQVLNVGDAATTLIGALSEKNADVSGICEVLSRIDQDRAQRAVLDAAMKSGGADRVALLGKVADSAKRFGNKLEARQVAGVLDLAAKGDEAEATAAAALLGALQVPNNELMPLILSK
ncbi:MAG: hypothetical protein GC200_11555 [Tepidisphaera sp.]|nr:hypothetical protein [Tepidisphaera sp.]